MTCLHYIEDMLQFIFDLHPGIAVRIAISLIHYERSCRSQSCSHLDIERRFTLRIRGMTIDVDEREMALKVDTAEVVLNIILVRSIGLHEVDGHVLAMQASLPELVVAISFSNISSRQGLGIGTTVERRMLRYA